MTPERIEGPYRMESGAIWCGDKLFWQQDDPDDPREPCDLLNTAFAAGKELGEKQALERVDRAAEKLGEFEVEQRTDGSTLIQSDWDKSAEAFKSKITAATFTQAILSTEGA